MKATRGYAISPLINIIFQFHIPHYFFSICTFILRHIYIYMYAGSMAFDSIMANFPAQ